MGERKRERRMRGFAQVARKAPTKQRESHFPLVPLLFQTLFLHLNYYCCQYYVGKVERQNFTRIVAHPFQQARLS